MVGLRYRSKRIADRRQCLSNWVHWQRKDSLQIRESSNKYHPTDLRRKGCLTSYIEVDRGANNVSFNLRVYIQNGWDRRRHHWTKATFSSCFAKPFLAVHPMCYARMLADKIAHHKTNAWLLNTGWVCAGASTGGKRCPSVISIFRYPRMTITNFLTRLNYTRAILDAIHSGELTKAEYETYDTFNLHVPTSCTGAPSEIRSH